MTTSLSRIHLDLIARQYLNTDFPLSRLKPRFSPVLPISLSAEGCGCLAEGLRPDCGQYGIPSRSSRYIFLRFSIRRCNPREPRLEPRKWKSGTTVRAVCARAVTQVVHTLPEGEPVIGVTSLGGEIYALKRKERDQVEVYDSATYSLQRVLTVPNARVFIDMTSCEHYRCAYISDRYGEYIHKLDVQAAAFTRWAVGDQPNGLSVNSSHNVLVTCFAVRIIKEFSSRGDLLRELTLPDEVIYPWHAIQTRDNEFVVCHGGIGDAVHRVCKMSADGRYIVHSHGGLRGSDHGQYEVPIRLAVDDGEFVFVVERENQRVRLLSPTLGHVRDIVSRDQLKWWPCRMCLDVQRRKLYIVENEYKENKATSGRVVVFSV